ncbi:MAG: extensin family protein [Pseudomonas sp.]|uniref:extensin-like domain-containing protein n=1 Tax=Pseudomonas sp. TaxID=306 RepID=UPI0030F16BD3
MRALLKLLIVVLVLGAAPFAVWRGWWQVPPQLNPWAPLDVRLEPNWLTPWKMMRLGQNRELCAQALATSSVRSLPLADNAANADCPLSNVVRVQGSALAFSSSFIATCPMAVAFAMYERHGLQPAAQAVYGQAVTRIDHLGSFACRNIGNSSRRSQHASANALDIAGFRLADGRRITVARDWNGKDDDARFLRLARDGACKAFSVTLGPDYNAAHHDHFHLDMGMFRLCR